ncbi:hypothetical protein [Vibrio sonorensis]|uniref:hypothetical protein n=1 Tax=Vibrio sonorensis TaxID=1004316 RepID=UPI0008DA4E9E|nr:hypothetical protein [Vibrio sonorensis]
MEVYVASEALECIAESIVYMRSDLSEFYTKGHMYEVLKVDDGIVHIIDHEGFDYVFAQEDVSQFFKKTSYQFPLETTKH